MNVRSCLIVFGVFFVVWGDMIAYHGLVKEDSDRLIELVDGKYEDDIESLIDTSVNTLTIENFIISREDLDSGSVSIQEKKVFHVKEHDGEKDYLPKYVRNQYGYPVATKERLLLATEYHISFIFHFESHSLVLWRDIDENVFCISHTWSPLLDKVDTSDCTTENHQNSNQIPKSSIRSTSYNIWNFNDEWETRAGMIVDNIIQDGSDFVAFQEVRYNIIDEYEYKRLGKERLRFQISELRNQFLAKSTEKWQYHYHPAMTYLDRFHTDEGLAIFSKYPIKETSFLVLSRDISDPDDAHQRIVLRALLDTPLGEINVFNSHFALTEVARKRAVVELWNWIQQYPTPHILMGDLNAEPCDIAIEFLVGKAEIDGVKGDFVDSFTLTSNENSAFTFPSWEPVKRIDFILFRGFSNALNYRLLGIKGVQHTNGESTLWPSDHFGISCDLVHR